MRKAMQTVGCSVFALFWIVGMARGQPLDAFTKTKEYIDQDVKRHRWELNVNFHSIIVQDVDGPVTYPFLLKLNYGSQVKTKAWRFLASPYGNNIRQTTIPDTTNRSHGKVNNYFWQPMFAVGHEWQRIYGRTSLFGGCDLATHFSRSKVILHDQLFDDEDGVKSRGTQVLKYRHDLFWIGTFIGAKLFLNHRVAVSLESHFLIIYSKDIATSHFNEKQIAYSQTTSHGTVPIPLYSINLGYNF
ncbi:hypothetical protein LZD49_30555 [Dyadobacter sp. CY261]|uniref:hypothetical protein n=1 Tax=Dyadobacter sp. CY261 TaxID=2907203 RepID=UPI001F1DEE16|nr:hypothetical protein [Dyadobacter sp. CY261]MCF0074868.1 hypothetical protein [Dyadobacter sp. CY261]